MKKLIPVIIAIALIVIIAVSSFGNMVYERYSYGQDRADLNEYFEIYSADDIPVILQDEKMGERAKLHEGQVYFDINFIKKHFTDRFYFDENEKLLLYTTPNTIFQADEDSDIATDWHTGETKKYNAKIWYLKSDVLYILADYVQQYVAFDYELFTDPNRMQLYTEKCEKSVATIKSDTQVRWRGGVKSEILTDVKEGDKVSVIEEMDEWTKVKTNDCFIGYVENSKLKDIQPETYSLKSGVKPEEFTYLTEGRKINLTWHNIEYAQDGSDLISALNYAQEVNVVSPTWYWLTDNDGAFSEVGNYNYVETAHKMDIEVWALISNFHSGADVDTYEVLGYTQKRRQLVTNLIASAIDYGIDGINLDFENMNSKTTPHFVQFVREMALACHENNLVLSVDNYVPTEYTAHYNRSEQAKFADYIIIMGYDEHYQGSEVGSVASVSWMSQGIADTIAAVGDSKRVINAIPFYTRVWKTTGGTVDSEAVTMQTANEFVAKYGIDLNWDDAADQNYGEATIGDTIYQVWMEDEDSVRVRLNVMKTYELAGVASWKVGQETPNIWNAIAEYMR